MVHPRQCVNELRREALDALLKKREVLRPWPTTEEHVPALPQRTLPPRRTLRVRFERWEQVPERALDGVEYLILPLRRPTVCPGSGGQRPFWSCPGSCLVRWSRTLPAALRPRRTRLCRVRGQQHRPPAPVPRPAHDRRLWTEHHQQCGGTVLCRAGTSSLLILPEVKDSDIASIAPARNGKPVPTGVMIYGHMPLMLTRACPLQNIHDCAHCDKTGVLTDRKAKKFQVRCGLGVRTIYNPVPIYMGDKPGALAVDYGVAYFTLESREEAAQVLDSIRTHAPFEGDFTRGLYFKGTN